MFKSRFGIATISRYAPRDCSNVASRPLLCIVFSVLATGCGASTAPSHRPVAGDHLSFNYDSSAPIDYTDLGRVNRRTSPIAIHDISFRSAAERIDGYLLLPPGRERRPAAVFVHGSGGDRTELLSEAAWLAARNVVTMTITEPSTSHPTTSGAGPLAILSQVRAAQIRDVVAIRRAVDLLQSLPEVDPRRIGYVGWSAGAKTGTYIAAAEPRVKSLVLLSAGADPIGAFVAAAPPSFRPAVRRILGAIDPISYIAAARPGSVLLEDGTKDEVVPHAALLNIIRAAASGTKVRWYDTPHALDRAAYHDAFDWLQRKLPIDGPSVPGAVTESTAR
jgi:dienelactone hydrolase